MSFKWVTTEYPPYIVNLLRKPFSGFLRTVFSIAGDVIASYACVDDMMKVCTDSDFVGKWIEESTVTFKQTVFSHMYKKKQKNKTLTEKDIVTS